MFDYQDYLHVGEIRDTMSSTIIRIVMKTELTQGVSTNFRIQFSPKFGWKLFRRNENTLDN